MVATLPRAFPITPYVRNPLPILVGGESAFYNNELQRISDTFKAYLEMLPQAATKAPDRLIDGMVRLSRDPWRPVASQTVDKWVYYDAAGGIWRYLATDPSNT
jgi:hypothetical protein